MTLRRDFELSEEDTKFLNDYELPWEAIVEGSQWVLLHDFKVPPGYNHAKVTVAIRIETGYPVTELNMVYFFPALTRRDGQQINAIDATQALDGKAYQRWSRHRTPQNPWKPGQDNIGTHIFLIEDWLEREFDRCPAR